LIGEYIKKSLRDGADECRNFIGISYFLFEIDDRFQYFTGTKVQRVNALTAVLVNRKRFSSKDAKRRYPLTVTTESVLILSDFASIGQSGW